MIKRLASLVILVLMVSQTYAQVNSEKLFVMEKVEKYHRMKNTGKTLTLLGSAAMVVGIVTAANASTTTTYSNGQTYQSTEGNPEAAALCILLGSAGLGAGIPLWIVGNHAEDKYKAKLSGFSLNVKPSSYNAGIALALRF